MKIKLSPSELMLGATVGILRQITDIRDSRSPAYGSNDENDWQKNIEGAIGELVVAKHFGIFWNGNIGKLSLPDVEEFQVRTKSKEHHKLILHQRDEDNAIFIQVCGVNGTYEVVGWLKAIDGKKEEYWADPVGGRAAYFVPQKALRPMDELTNHIKE